MLKIIASVGYMIVGSSAVLAMNPPFTPQMNRTFSSIPCGAGTILSVLTPAHGNLDWRAVQMLLYGSDKAAACAEALRLAAAAAAAPAPVVVAPAPVVVAPAPVVVAPAPVVVAPAPVVVAAVPPAPPPPASKAFNAGVSGVSDAALRAALDSLKKVSAAINAGPLAVGPASPYVQKLLAQQQQYIRQLLALKDKNDERIQKLRANLKQKKKWGLEARDLIQDLRDAARISSGATEALEARLIAQGSLQKANQEQIAELMKVLLDQRKLTQELRGALDVKGNENVRSAYFSMETEQNFATTELKRVKLISEKFQNALVETDKTNAALHEELASMKNDKVAQQALLWEAMEHQEEVVKALKAQLGRKNLKTQEGMEEKTLLMHRLEETLKFLDITKKGKDLNVGEVSRSLISVTLLTAQVLNLNEAHVQTEAQLGAGTEVLAKKVKELEAQGEVSLDEKLKAEIDLNQLELDLEASSQEQHKISPEKAAMLDKGLKLLAKKFADNKRATYVVSKWKTLVAEKTRIKKWETFRAELEGKAKTAANRAKDDLDQAHWENQRLQSTIDFLKGSHDLQIKALEQRLAELGLEFDIAKEVTGGALSLLRKERDDLAHALGALKGKSGDQEVAIQALTKKIEGLNTKAERLQLDHAQQLRLEEQRHAMQVKSLGQLLAKAHGDDQAQAAVLLGQIEILAATVGALTDNLGKSQESGLVLAGRAADLFHKLEALKKSSQAQKLASDAEVKAVEAQVVKLMSDVAGLQREIVDLKVNNADVIRDSETLKIRIDDAQKYVAQAENCTGEARAACAQIKEEAVLLTRELSQKRPVSRDSVKGRLHDIQGMTARLDTAFDGMAEALGVSGDAQKGVAGALTPERKASTLSRTDSRHRLLAPGQQTPQAPSEASSSNHQNGDGTLGGSPRLAQRGANPVRLPSGDVYRPMAGVGAPAGKLQRSNSEGNSRRPSSLPAGESYGPMAGFVPDPNKRADSI